MEPVTPMMSPGGGRGTGVVSCAEDFYRDSLKLLDRKGVPFLVGGTYALNHFTGIVRPTKDLDLFIAPGDVLKVLEQFRAAGFRTELTDSLWLAKIFRGECFIDLIFRSGNGIAEVDMEWFKYAQDSVVFGVPVKLCPPEETIWSKAFTMERERYDGADIAHLLLACGHELDWRRLVDRFDRHWRILLSYLVLFGYQYPGERRSIPGTVLAELIGRLETETDIGDTPDADAVRLCQGTLLSRTQYRVDVEAWGYRDGRRDAVAGRHESSRIASGIDDA